MSLSHLEIMLKTIKQYEKSDITLTFNNVNQVPILSVCYQNKHFHLTYLKVDITEAYDNIHSTISAINKALPYDI